MWYDDLFLRFRLTCNYRQTDWQTDRPADQRATTLVFIIDGADFFSPAAAAPIFGPDCGSSLIHLLTTSSSLRFGAFALSVLHGLMMMVHSPRYICPVRLAGKLRLRISCWRIADGARLWRLVDLDGLPPPPFLPQERRTDTRKAAAAASGYNITGGRNYSGPRVPFVVTSQRRAKYRRLKVTRVQPRCSRHEASNREPPRSTHPLLKGLRPPQLCPKGG